MHWADYFSQLDWSNLPDSVRNSTVLVVSDTIGGIVAGLRTAEIKQLLNRCESGDVPIFSTPTQTDLASAGLLLGTAAVSLEVDEGNQYSFGHPAAHAVPTALAAAVKNRSTGIDFLTAVVVGYEVGSRFGRKYRLRPDLHAHGTWGIAGAAAAAAYVNKLSSDQFRQAVMMGSGMVPATSWQTALDGDTIRNLYAGHAAMWGTVAPALVSAGFTVPIDIADRTLGNVLGCTDISTSIDDLLGERFDIELNYFKPYAFCRYSHSAIEAAQQAAHGLTPKEIDHIEVRTFLRASTLNNRVPANQLAAKFSIPYGVASAIALHRADQAVFSPALFQNPDVMNLIDRVSVVHDAALDEAYPAEMVAKAVVYGRDGTVREASCKEAKGSQTNPLSPGDLYHKFEGLVSDFGDAVKLWDAIAELPSVVDMRDWAVQIGKLFSNESKEGTT